MLDPAAVPPVDANELLARFVTQRSQFRQGDRTLKQDLFVPHPRAELSVTRHRDATAEEVWQFGREVAAALGRTLYGRGDLRASDCTAHSLRVEPQPLPDNPNHANVLDWPVQKQDQKAIAIRLAAAAGKLIPAPS